MLKKTADLAKVATPNDQFNLTITLLFHLFCSRPIFANCSTLFCVHVHFQKYLDVGVLRLEPGWFIGYNMYTLPTGQSGQFQLHFCELA